MLLLSAAHLYSAYNLITQISLFLDLLEKGQSIAQKVFSKNLLKIECVVNF